jgi:hypothetical protein
LPDREQRQKAGIRHADLLAQQRVGGAVKAGGQLVELVAE